MIEQPVKRRRGEALLTPVPEFTGPGMPLCVFSPIIHSLAFYSKRCWFQTLAPEFCRNPGVPFLIFFLGIGSLGNVRISKIQLSSFPFFTSWGRLVRHLWTSGGTDYLVPSPRLLPFLEKGRGEESVPTVLYSFVLDVPPRVKTRTRSPS